MVWLINVFHLQCPEIFFYEPPVDHGPVKAELEYLETHTPIADGKFIAGDHMTIADMSAVACVTFLEPINFDFSPFPKIQEWVAKMKAEPFYTECNACFEDWKVEVKTDEWKRKNEIRMAKKGKSVFKSILTNPDVKAPKSIEADTKWSTFADDISYLFSWHDIKWLGAE